MPKIGIRHVHYHDFTNCAMKKTNHVGILVDYVGQIVHKLEFEEYYA